MHKHESTIERTRTPEGFELRYCFLCDADAPHLSTRMDDAYLFKCGACFAAHSEPLPDELLVPGSGRHRVD